MVRKHDDLKKIFGSAASALLDLDTKARCEESLIEFTDYAWPIIDPATKLMHNYTMDAIAAHLEATIHGHIKRLLITVFPGSSKSTLLSIMLPAFVWGPLNMPWMRFISASYSEHISWRDNLRCRQIITNDRYTQFWGDRFTITQPDTATKFQNDKTGWKLATSVGGVGLGERADCWLIDDPNSPKLESEIVRVGTNRWFTEVVPDRLNSMTESKIIVIQQRLHLEDVAGTAIAKDMGYVHLNIPMEYMPRRYVNGYVADTNEIRTFFDEDALDVPEENVFWRDWRVEDGELAWPERFPRKVVDQLKKDKGPTAYSAMYQQMPVPRGGSIIKSEWWQVWKDNQFPAFSFLLATLDTAYTKDKANDPSAMTIWGLCQDVLGNPRIMLVYAWTEHMEFHDLVERVIATCTVDRRDTPYMRFPVDKLVIEHKASGKSVAQEIERLVGFSGKFGIEGFNPDRLGDKTARIQSVEYLFAQRIIWAPDRAYAQDVIDQLANYPYSEHDEYVDCTSMALRWFRDCGFMPMREETDEAARNEIAFKPKMKPLYFPY